MKYCTKYILCVSLGIAILITSITGILQASLLAIDSSYSGGRIGTSTDYIIAGNAAGNDVYNADDKTQVMTDPGLRKSCR